VRAQQRAIAAVFGWRAQRRKVLEKQDVFTPMSSNPKRFPHSRAPSHKAQSKHAGLKPGKCTTI